MEPIDVFKFCPRCQKVLTRDAANRVSCNNCQWIHFVNASPGTSILVFNEKQELLLVKRAVEPKAGYWDLLGGFLNLNENLETGAKREILEETGIEINSTDLVYLGSVESRYLYSGVDHFVISAIFSFKLPVGKKIEPSDDISLAEFFPLNQIPWDGIAFKPIAEFIAQALEDLQQK